MIVDDSFNYHARLNTNYHSLSSTITNYHAVWTLFKFDMIVHDSFFPFDRADEQFRQTIMNYHGPFDRKHDSFFPFDRADEQFRQTIMNYHGPFDRKHDS